MNIIIRSVVFFYIFLTAANGYADTSISSADTKNPSENILMEKQREENKILSNDYDYAITLYKVNYIFPYYYTGSPYNSVYVNETPDNEKLKRPEVSFQLSFKIPLWHNIPYTRTSLYFGYTQLSYWQLYNKKAFFRSTDYEPEIFTYTKINKPLGRAWYLNSLKVGAVHQSNGFGNNMERSWNRLYIEVSASNDSASISVRPWYIFHDSTYEQYNSNLADYLGYGEVIMAYKFSKQVVSCKLRNLIEHGGRHATGIFAYSFPISNHFNGYVEFFSGYGQSLIEYNHHTNSFGLGFSINDYI